MKRIVYLASVLFLASSIISCQKELQNEENPINDKGGVTVNVVAGGEVESKTSAVVDGTTTKFKWTEGDAITLYEFVDGEQNEYRNSNATTISTDGYSATFKVTLENSDPEGSNYVYTACYPAEAFTTSNSIERYQIPSTQNLSADGNFDPAADIMFGKSAPRNERVADDTDLGFSFKRLGTVVKLTLKGISSGEKINEISITAPVNIAGYCKINFMTGEVGTLAYSVATNTIKLNAGGFTSDGEDVVWLRCIEGSWEAGKKFTIVIDTDKAGYTKEITIPEGGLEFSAGGLTKLTIGSLGDYRKEKSNVVYSKVTSAPDDWSGEYLLVYESSTTEAYVWTGVDASSCYAKASITDNNISSLPAGAAILTIATMDGGYSIKVNGDDSKFVGQTSDSNGMSINGTPKANTISINDDGSVQITSSSAVMRYNANNGQDRFRYYKSSSYSAQQPVQLYKKKSTLPTINAKNINDVTATGVSDETATYTLENIETDDIEVSAYDGIVTNASKDEDGMIKYSVGANYTLEEASGTITLNSPLTGASKIISVTQKASVFEVSPAELQLGKAASSTAEFVVKSTFAGADAITIDNTDDFELSASAYAANETDGTTITVTAKNAGLTDAERKATITITRTELESKTISVKQLQNIVLKLDAPQNISITKSTTSKIGASWTAPAESDNITSYKWVISTSETSDGITEGNTIATGNANVTSFEKEGTFATEITYYVYVRSESTSPDFEPSDYARSEGFTVTAVTDKTASVTFSNLYSSNTSLNGVEVKIDDYVSITFNNGGGTNPQYYATGAAVRAYAKNNLTITASKGSITKVELTFATGGDSNTITADTGTYLNDVWTGDASSVKFTIAGTSGHRRISAIKVYYSGSFPTVNVTGVTINKNETEISVGGMETLTATVNPNDATNKKVTWSSDDPTTASVNATTGEVTGVKEGTATITVTTEDGGYTASCEVTVTTSVTPSETVYKDAETTFTSSTLTDGWTTNGTFNSSYYKMTAGQYAEATSTVLFKGQVLSTDMKIDVACGTFGTWSGDKKITLKAAFYDSSDNDLSSKEFTTGTLNSTQGTYRGEFTLSKPADPSKIAYMKIIFETLKTGNEARFAKVKLNYSTTSK